MKWFRACLPRMSFCLAGVLPAFMFPAPATAASCSRWVAKVVSVQGSVQAQRTGEERPLPARLNDTFCPGDKIRVEEEGRAVLLLSNETLLRLDRNTTIRFYEPEKERNFLLDLLEGAAYFITRTPKRFQCTTPYVNAGVEGTEFLMVVGNGRTFLSIFEGTVLAGNAYGALRLAGGESAVAEEGKPPIARIVARPRDAVQWTLYYPPILPPGPSGDSPGEPGTWQSRVSRLLSVGRVDQAKSEIEEVLERSPGDGSALSLRSVIAVAQNEKGKALDLARMAVEADPRHAPARIALSYAQQAGFDLAGARTSVGEALRLEPENALAWARMSELYLSTGDLDKSLDAANKAAGFSPGLARTQSVLGFAYLAQIKTKASKEAFEKAIVLDQADPLPRLGLGLAKIREGDLTDGRREIEIAAGLDPNNSLIRSYLGKAYYEEKRDKLASSQLEMAKELDPSDPTPFFYDAIRKQTLNRPVEALRDLQKSISLNDNRAVYRSRLLLDEDLAARSASLGRIYGDLGFQQLALVEGWKSVNSDPANYSAHRFLADSYSALPRHEIARVSELLQSQLLQPITVNPAGLLLSQSRSFILEGSGPSSAAFNEFTPLFTRNGLTLYASGVAGDERTFSDELNLSGIQGPFAFSAGQFYYQTKGFRPNNDLRKTIYDLVGQAGLSYATNLQAELRVKHQQNGDLTLNFDPNSFIDTLRQETDSFLARAGLRHSFSPGSDLLVSLQFQKERGDSALAFPPPDSVSFLDQTKTDGTGIELQHIFREERFNLISGAARVDIDQKTTSTTDISPPLPEPVTNSEQNLYNNKLYLYSRIRFPDTIVWTVGASMDFSKGQYKYRDQFNPKLGVIWNPLPGTTLRGAAFRTLEPVLIADQTLEPTQVAGFNQYFSDGNGTSAWAYGAAVDQKFSGSVFGGLEYLKRDMKLPVELPTPDGTGLETIEVDWKEQTVRGYLYWTPHRFVSLSGEYQYERNDRDLRFPAGIENLKTQRVPLGINFFHPSGIGFRLMQTHVYQEGSFISQFGGGPGTPGTPDSSRFWLTDAAVSYRLPSRLGFLTLEGKNLFDEHFKYQDTDPFNPQIQPRRTVYFKVTLAL